jgi:hypothetical protein
MSNGTLAVTYEGILEESGNPSNLWLYNKKWDLTFISLSAVLVFYPIGFYYLFNALGYESENIARNIVNGVVTLSIGGPHMYSTFTRTFLDKSFSAKHHLFLASSLLIPIAVIYFGLFYFDYLVTVFFFWASVHIMHQIVYIVESYNRRSTISTSLYSRAVDYAVVFSSLYPLASYKLAEFQPDHLGIGTKFQIGQLNIMFPEFAKVPFTFYFTLGFFTVALILFVHKTIKEFRQNCVHYPKLLLISLTVAISFFIPAFPNLDVSFQGFNAWHSFQYLGLTWYINRLRREKGILKGEIVEKITTFHGWWKFYGFNLLCTSAAITVIAVLLIFRVHIGELVYGAGKELKFDQCYYMVVLSFLLMHYFQDHLLFVQKDAMKP